MAQRCKEPGRGERRPRLNYANVIATLALFIALGGSAYAVQRNSVGSKQLKKNAVRAKNVAKNAIGTKKIRNRSVTAAKLAKGVAASGPAGPPGPPGPAGSALAFASVQPNGDINTAHSKNVSDANVTRPGDATGRYCFGGLGGSPRNAVATTTSPNRIAGAIFEPATICPPDTQFLVQIVRRNDGVRQNTSFMIVFN